jgi:hypothetical protein
MVFQSILITNSNRTEPHSSKESKSVSSSLPLPLLTGIYGSIPRSQSRCPKLRNSGFVVSSSLMSLHLSCAVQVFPLIFQGRIRLVVCAFPSQIISVHTWTWFHGITARFLQATCLIGKNYLLELRIEALDPESNSLLIFIFTQIRRFRHLLLP